MKVIYQFAFDQSLDDPDYPLMHRVKENTSIMQNLIHRYVQDKYVLPEGVKEKDRKDAFWKDYHRIFTSMTPFTGEVVKNFWDKWMAVAEYAYELYPEVCPDDVPRDYWFGIRAQIARFVDAMSEFAITVQNLSALPIYPKIPILDFPKSVSPFKMFESAHAFCISGTETGRIRTDTCNIIPHK